MMVDESTSSSRGPAPSSRSRDPADYQGQVLSSRYVDGLVIKTQDIFWPWPFPWSWTRDFVGIVVFLPSLTPRYLSGRVGKIPRAAVAGRRRPSVLALLAGVT